jgi:hypothetical protein
MVQHYTVLSQTTAASLSESVYNHTTAALLQFCLPAELELQAVFAEQQL